ncbi:hypothetical protein NL676_007065 [Syzygium grande]|nr:hypothetical protein NL676_007065 [Syzygium grande]
MFLVEFPAFAVLRGCCNNEGVRPRDLIETEEGSNSVKTVDVRQFSVCTSNNSLVLLLQGPIRVLLVFKATLFLRTLLFSNCGRESLKLLTTFFSIAFLSCVCGGCQGTAAAMIIEGRCVAVVIVVVVARFGLVTMRRRRGGGEHNGGGRGSVVSDPQVWPWRAW